VVDELNGLVGEIHSHVPPIQTTRVAQMLAHLHPLAQPREQPLIPHRPTLVGEDGGLIELPLLHVQHTHLDAVPPLRAVEYGYLVQYGRTVAVQEVQL
jgi:hypothetical protein